MSGPGEPSLGQAAAGQAVATVIPRGSARTVGIPAGDAASIRAAIAAGPVPRQNSHSTLSWCFPAVISLLFGAR